MSPRRGARAGEDRDATGPVFAALSDPTRRAVVRLLADEGPRSATELAGDLPVSRQAVAKHLAALADAGLVELAEVQGREKRYRLTPAPFAEAAGWMAEVGGRWDERLDALRRHLDGEGGTHES
jgi:ArsR family transcriptional regulator, cadmium/lead-responsive transcriptional repressor